MSNFSESPGEQLLLMWGQVAHWPGGRRMFARMLRQFVPYTGSIRATVLEFEYGRAVVELRDRKRVRNHLGSIHAIALANLGELATGLSVLSSLPPTVRGILTGIEMTYAKKARGRLTVEARCELDPISERTEHVVEADIIDASGDVVATARATWLLSPRRWA